MLARRLIHKFIRIFALVLSSQTFGTNEPFNGKGEFVSPDGTVRIDQPEYRGPIFFFDSKTGRLFSKTESQARFIEVVWSADSRWVAICERTSRISAFTRAFAVSLPSVKEILFAFQRKEIVLNTLPKGQRLRFSHDDGFAFTPQQWLPGGKLVVDSASSGVVRDTSRQKQSYDTVRVRFVVQCFHDGTSKVIERKLLGVSSETALQRADLSPASVLRRTSYAAVTRNLVSLCP